MISMKSSFLRSFSRLVGVTLAGLPLVTQAESVSWIGGTTISEWFTPGKWSSNSLPGSQDHVIIANNSGAEIHISSGGAAEVDTLTLNGRYFISNKSVKLYITSGSLTIGSQLTLGSISGGLYTDRAYIGISGSTAALRGLSGATLLLGDHGWGELSISDSAVVSFDTVIMGAQSDGNAQLQLNGVEGNRGVLEIGHIAQGNSGATGVRLYINGGILRALGEENNFIRDFVPGYLNFQAGGAFIDTNGFEVGITNSVLLYGVGGLTKIGAGTLTLSGTGNYTGGTIVKEGTLIVKAGGSLYGDNPTLTVGATAGDEAYLRLEAGGRIQYDNTIIGHAVGSFGAATVTGTGSLLKSGYVSDTPGVLTVGYSGTGTLTIADGGQSTSRTILIGRELGSEGSVTVTGVHAQGAVASLLNTSPNLDNTLTIGQRGSGTLTVAEGGIARVRSGTGAIIIAAEAGSQGTINIGAYDLTHATKAGKVEAATVVFGAGSGTINFNQTDTSTFSASMSGSGSIVQRGTGTTILSGTHTHTGGTFVQDGKLIVTGLFTQGITVEGGTLGGTGTIGAIHLDSGVLAPGNTVGRLRATELIWGDGVIAFDLGVNAASSDFLELGTLTATGESLRFTFLNNGWVAGKTYSLLSFTAGSVGLEKFGFTNGDGFDGVFSYDGDTLQFTLTSAIPEPSTYALAFVALATAVAYRHRAAVNCDRSR